MPLDLTAEQKAKAQLPSTQPVYLVEHAFNGTLERVSCGESVVYAGELYTGGGAKVTGITDSLSADVELPFSTDRIMSLTTGAYRRSVCRIFYVPAAPDEADLVFEEDEGVLLIDGEMASASYDGVKRIKVNVTQVNNNNKLSPAHTWDQVSPHCPPNGAELVWAGTRYILQQRQVSTRLPNETQRSTSVNKRLSATKLKGLAQDPQSITLTTTGAGSPIKVIYGFNTVAGDIIALGDISGDLVAAVGWGYGEVNKIRKLFINDVEVVDGGVVGTDITFTNYVGKYNQPVDSTLVTAVAGFNSPFVLNTTNGIVGTAYTVFRIPVGLLSGSPTFKCLVEGLGVTDPRIVGENDSCWANDVFAINFSNVIDVSPNQLPFVLGGSGFIDGNQLVCDGAGYLRVPYDASMEIPANELFEIVVRFTVGGSGVTQWICGTETNAGSTNRGWALRINSSDDLIFDMSSDGTTWGMVAYTMASGLEVGSSHVVTIRRRTTDSIRLLLDGEVLTTITDASAVYTDGASGLVVGAHADSTTASDYFVGLVDYFRFTVGNYRPALDSGSITSGLPFPEYEQYSNVSVLCGTHLASNTIFGMGVGTLGVDVSANWNEELLGGLYPRCELGLVLSNPQNTANYLDLIIGEYAECFWYYSGRNIRIVPNNIVGVDNPHGDSVVSNASFDDGATGWTVGADGGATSFSSGVMSIDGTQTSGFTVHQTVEVDVGAKYVLEVTVTDEIGDYRVDCEGVGDIPTSNDSGTSKVIITPTSGTLDITFVVDAAFVGNVSELNLTRLYWAERDLVKGTLRITGIEESNSPTSVSTKYTEPDTGTPLWPTKKGGVLRLVGVDTGELPAVETTLYLEGINRVVEADNKSNIRVYNYRNRVRYQWVTTDIGVRHKKGDVVQMTKAAHGLDAIIRITSAAMTEYGRYAVTGMRYSDDQHPSEVPSPVGTGVVPEGVITLLNAAAAPVGWELWDDANGSYILGAGSTYSVGDTGGSPTFAGWSGNTDDKSMHDTGFVGSPFYNDKDAVRNTPAAVSADVYVGHEFDTDHHHTYATGTITPNLLRRKQRLMIKVGGDAAYMPKEALVFGLENIVALGVNRVTSFANRLLVASNSQGSEGVSSKLVSLTTGLTNVNHSHYQYTGTPLNKEPRTGYFTSPNPYYSDANINTNHSHTVGITLTRSPKKIALPLWGSNEDYSVVPGMYFLWSGLVGAIPTDYVLADGSNGTHDCRNFFIEISQMGSEGNTSGNNTLALSGDTQVAYHHHKGDLDGSSTTRKIAVSHSNSAPHFHSISRSGSWMPPYYALAVIMYAPS